MMDPMKEYSDRVKAERAAKQASPQRFTFRTTDPENAHRNGQTVEMVRRDGYSPGGMFVLVRFPDGEQFVAGSDELTLSR